MEKIEAEPLRCGSGKKKLKLGGDPCQTGGVLGRCVGQERIGDKKAGGREGGGDTFDLGNRDIPKEEEAEKSEEAGSSRE